MIDPEDPEVEDPLETFYTLQNELKTYSSDLIEKPASVVLTKKDTWLETNWLEALQGKLPYPVVAVSAVTRDGLEALKHQIWDQLNAVNESSE